jgi:hypothetical protein
LTSGTLFSKGTSDGKWEAPGQATESTGTDTTLDPDPSAEVNPGTQDFLFEFTNLEQINRLAFQQKGKGGVVRIFTADAPYPADSPRWNSVNDDVDTGSDSIVNVNFPTTSMRFMKMTVEYPEGGALDSMLVSGDTYIEDNSEMVPPPEEWPNSTERIDYDFARSAAGGKVTHVASGKAEESHNITDGDPSTFHEFDSNENGVYFNVGLAEDYPISEASIMTDQAIGSVEIWTFNTMPDDLLAEDAGDGQARGLNVSDAFISQRRPNGRIQVDVDDDVNELTIPIPDTTARYVLVKVVGKYPDQPMRVRMFSAKGRVPRELFNIPTNRTVFAQRVVSPQQQEASSGGEGSAGGGGGANLPRIPFASP